ncbi:DNA topoisomerase-3 [Succinivibrio dextrinosolvens]|uniref:DNA topoisomerase 3 n=1 Tax=Succinivibrio dextrinosolvens TaxID=83771 RepID=UPI0008E33A40|nr:DNA topoisomerase 3 [Succinivibrio dextrinosolvens]SFS32630.1 DNA topoisomerase-3 [Succinivibrio dextrinosolvens]
MRVYLAEKASQARDLANVLDSSNVADDGYIRVNEDEVVTWCHGHLLSLADPDYYDPALKVWDVKTLPFVPTQFEWLPVKDIRSKKQLRTAASLVTKADEVVVSTDYDREGQLIAQNVLNYCNYSGKTYRLKLSALDPTSIRKALNNIEPLNATHGLYQSAIARSCSDWIVGLNMTRLFTCLSSNGVRHEVVNIGRILTPTVNLICQRDEAIKNFVSRDFYEVQANVMVQNGSFRVKWIPAADQLDPEGHLFDEKAAAKVISDIDNKSITLTAVDRTVQNENPPLPFSLSRLQIYAARHFGFSASKTLEIAQALYERKLTTYPRADCQYLPKAQFEDAKTILKELSNDPTIAPMVNGCDLTKCPRAFSDKKMEGHAHNAIIPSTGKQDFSSLSSDEFKIYNIIRLFYIAQFYAPAQYDVLTIKAKCEGYDFIARGKTLIKAGYRMIFHNEELDSEDSPTKENKDTEIANIPNVKAGEQGYVNDPQMQIKHTRAPKHFDEASLIEAMTNVAKYVSDAEQKKILNQTLGLGTESSRATIIENLKKYGWIEVVKNHYEATAKAFSTMSILPEEIKSPTMTALWELELDNIVNAGTSANSDVFINSIVSWLNSVCSKCKSSEVISRIQQIVSANTPDEPKFFCEKCKAPLRLIKGKNGLFFGCTNPDCKQTYQELNRKPVPLFNPETAPKCPKCANPMRQYKGKFGIFWKCQHNDCGLILNDSRGKPCMPVKCPNCNGLVMRHKGKFGYFWKCEGCESFFNEVAGKPMLLKPKCPKCGGEMRYISKRKDGTKLQKPFFSCMNYPKCDGTLDMHGNEPDNKRS